MASNPSPLPLRGVRRLAGLATLALTALAGCAGEHEPDAAARRDPASAPGRAESSPRRSGAAARGAEQSDDIDRPHFSFVDRAAEWGVRFEYRNDEEAGHVSILESLGGGTAVLDFDADGWMDLFFPGGGVIDARTVRGRSPALFRNGGGGFAEVTGSAAVGTAPFYSHGAAVTDYDHDGFADILVTGFGGLLLLRNCGDGTFREAARESGLDDALWSSSAAWGDLDGDTHPDLYVAHYADWSFDNDPFCDGPMGRREICPPRRFGPLPDVVYFANGDGTFRNGSVEAGLRKDGKGLGVMTADIDLDGDLDVYVANDAVENFLYVNDGAGRLEDRSLMSGTALSAAGTPDGSMGIDVGDYDLDGLPDIWVSNYEREAFALYRNLGGLQFLHVSQGAGVTAVAGLYVGWGTVFCDFDGDEDEDVFVSNGHVIRYPTSAPVKQKPLLFRNGRGRFAVAPTDGGYMGSTHMGRGVAVGDLDNDGDVDVAVSHVNEPVAVLSNETVAGNGLAFRLIGRESGRHPIGTIVRLRTANGMQVRQLRGGASYASTSDSKMFFGIGDARHADKVEIRWPSGRIQILHDVPGGHVVTVVEADDMGRGQTRFDPIRD